MMWSFLILWACGGDHLAGEGTRLASPIDSTPVVIMKAWALKKQEKNLFLGGKPPLSKRENFGEIWEGD